MESEINPLKMPEVILKALGDKLKATEGVDADLASILTTHILKANPVPNAVTKAKDAILKLASERANPLNPDAAND